MKDKSMMRFYITQANLGDMTSAYARWQDWAAANEEQPGTLAQFVGRLRRTHEHVQRRGDRQGSRCPVRR